MAVTWVSSHGPLTHPLTPQFKLKATFLQSVAWLRHKKCSSQWGLSESSVDETIAALSGRIILTRSLCYGG